MSVVASGTETYWVHVTGGELNLPDGKVTLSAGTGSITITPPMNCRGLYLIEFILEGTGINAVKPALLGLID